MPYRTIYLELRTAIKVHIMSGNPPELSLSTRPTGAFDWQPIENGTVRQVHLSRDGPDDDMFDQEQEE